MPKIQSLNVDCACCIFHCLTLPEASTLSRTAHFWYDISGRRSAYRPMKFPSFEEEFDIVQYQHWQEHQRQQYALTPTQLIQFSTSRVIQHGLHDLELILDHTSTLSGGSASGGWYVGVAAKSVVSENAGGGSPASVAAPAAVELDFNELVQACERLHSIQALTINRNPTTIQKRKYDQWMNEFDRRLWTKLITHISPKLVSFQLNIPERLENCAPQLIAHLSALDAQLSLPHLRHVVFVGGWEWRRSSGVFGPFQTWNMAAKGGVLQLVRDAHSESHEFYEKSPPPIKMDEILASVGSPRYLLFADETFHPVERYAGAFRSKGIAFVKRDHPNASEEPATYLSDCLPRDSQLQEICCFIGCYGLSSKADFSPFIRVASSLKVVQLQYEIEHVGTGSYTDSTAYNYFLEYLQAAIKAYVAQEAKSKNQQTIACELSEVDAQLFVQRMEKAATTDRELTQINQPAMTRLQMLPEIELQLSKPNASTVLIDAGLLRVLNIWLTTEVDGPLPNIKLRTVSYQLLSMLPVTESDLARSDGLGKTMMYLWRHMDETVANQRVLEALLQKWMKPALGLEDDFRRVNDVNMAAVLSGDISSPFIHVTTLRLGSGFEKPAWIRGFIKIETALQVFPNLDTLELYGSVWIPYESNGSMRPLRSLRHLTTPLPSLAQTAPANPQYITRIMKEARRLESLNIIVDQRVLRYGCAEIIDPLLFSSAHLQQFMITNSAWRESEGFFSSRPKDLIALNETLLTLHLIWKTLQPSHIIPLHHLNLAPTGMTDLVPLFSDFLPDPSRIAYLRHRCQRFDSNHPHPPPPPPSTATAVVNEVKSWFTAKHAARSAGAAIEVDPAVLTYFQIFSSNFQLRLTSLLPTTFKIRTRAHFRIILQMEPKD